MGMRGREEAGDDGVSVKLMELFESSAMIQYHFADIVAIVERSSSSE